MDIFAGIIAIIAKILTGNKNKWGHIGHIIAESIWIFIAIKLNLYGLIIIAIPTILISIRNFLKWNNEKNNN